jgi:thioredoxin 2
MTATATSSEPGASTKLTVQCHFCLTWNRVATARLADRPKCGKCAKPMLFDRPWTLSDDSFERTLTESEIPVLVDFYADWCGPCKMMAPALDELARTYMGRLLIAKLDTDRAPRISQQFHITGIPTTIVFNAGREIVKQVGAMPKSGLEALIKQAL